MLQAPADAPPLYADQLTRGYRIDVREADKGRWRSLCRRKARYHCDGWSWPSAEDTLEDEGVIEPTAHVDDHAAQTTLRATEDLVEWDGWSLVVPWPDHAAGPNTAAIGRGGSGGETALKVDIQVTPGSLQPQRFGRCYQFRARAVDLAGNSLTVDEANAIAPALPMETIATPPVCYLRVESAKPPVLLRAQPRGPGEAGDTIVIRDAESWSDRTIESRMHVLPPEVPLRMAEKHGIFDALSPSDAWRLIRGHRGALAFENLQGRRNQKMARPKGTGPSSGSPPWQGRSTRPTCPTPWYARPCSCSPTGPAASPCRLSTTCPMACRDASWHAPAASWCGRRGGKASRPARPAVR